MGRAVQADVSVFSIGGASQLAYFKNVSFEYSPALADGRAVNSRTPRNDVVKRSGKIMTGLMSNVGTNTTDARVANLDVTELLVGTQTYISYLRGGSLSINNTFGEGSGVGDAWKVPIWTTQKISGNVQIAVDSATFPAGLGAIVDGSIAGHNLAFAVTINGVALSLAAVVSGWKHVFENDTVQMIDISFEQRGALTGAPATTTALGAAITQPGTAVACVLTSKASTGSSYAGDFVYDSVSFNFNDAEIISTEYTLISTGAITQT
jgi:hypothetical protein